MLNDDKLIFLLKNNNRKAKEHLYIKYTPILKRYCKQLTKNDYISDDLLHESYLKIFKNIHQFSGKSSFEGWIKKIIKNTYINNIKKENITEEYIDDFQIEKRRKNINREEMISFLYNDIKNNDIKNNENIIKFSKNDIINVLKKLSPGYKKVFELYYVEKKSHKEISNILNITESTSKSQLCKAKKYIKKMLLKK